MTKSSNRRGSRDGVSDRFVVHAERVQRAAARELDELFRGEIEDRALGAVRVLEAELSIDGRHLRVHVAAPSSSRSALERATPFLRARLADALDLDRVPELRFVVHPEIEL